MVAALVTLLVVGAAPAPLASGPRPVVDLRPPGLADRTTPPPPHVDPRFKTLPFTDTFGTPGTWVVASGALPLRMTVEQEVISRYGLDALASALEVWNGSPGSRFAVTVSGTTATGTDHKVRDGVNRVFLDRRDCGERYLARAHLYPGEVQIGPGRSVAWVREVDIGICERLTPELMPRVLRHEVAHVAGLGHLCDRGSECWTPEMGPDNRCRIMNPASYPCQERTRGDEDGLILLHPDLPRVAGVNRVGTAAAVSYLAFPRTRAEDTVLATSIGADEELQAAAATLAGIARVPHLLVDEDCTHGTDGEELNRVASIGATVVLVGPVPNSCEDDLRVGWELATERLDDVGAVTDRIVAAVGEPDRLVLTVRPEDEPTGVADAMLAVPAAVGLGAPLLTTPTDDLDGAVADVLEAVPSIRGVVLIGGPRSVSPEVVEALETDHDVRVRRLDTTDRVAVGLKVSRMRDVFGGDPHRAVFVAADRAADGFAAANLAGLLGGPVVPVFTGPASPDVRVAGYLADHVAGGFVVGGEEAISRDLFIRLNRARDGAL